MEQQDSDNHLSGWEGEIDIIKGWLERPLPDIKEEYQEEEHEDEEDKNYFTLMLKILTWTSGRDSSGSSSFTFNH